MIATLAAAPDLIAKANPDWVMSVLGPVDSESLGVTLIHEHVMADFIGADKTGPHRYDVDEVVKVVLPYLQELKQAGCHTFVECTATYLGR
ncbi:MAG: phosphotriesterase, partial [Bacteroidia bacterium]|nr:phosphotriesterase [Bacteroidia bacterium]